jgi:hypothetical protein
MGTGHLRNFTGMASGDGELLILIWSVFQLGKVAQSVGKLIYVEVASMLDYVSCHQRLLQQITETLKFQSNWPPWQFLKSAEIFEEKW